MPPKYQQVYDKLSREILSGKYAAGQKFPSEAALTRQFHTSRITIGRALGELTRRGLVQRIAGSGTYVKNTAAADAAGLFGLLIPDLGTTEIFEPICQGIAGSPEAGRHALLWGHTADPLALCDQFIQRGVSGVFFAPLEHRPDVREINLTILKRLEAAHIPIVLLDRCVMPYPQRSRHDLVGIDNRRAGYLATEHLLRTGAARVHFLAHAGGAPTVDARIAGFREALLAHSAPLHANPVHLIEPIDETILQGTRPGDGFVCANDRTAGRLMHLALAKGYRIPADLSIVGIDDVEYATLLPVPLTTVHQPCREIGEAALDAMLTRIQHPNMLPRDVLLECRLVVRSSSGPR